MDDEFGSLQDNTTRELVTLPPRWNLVQCKWIFKTKLETDGTTTKYKDQLVENGYSQVHGMDYNDTFDPVARMDSIY